MDERGIAYCVRTWYCRTSDGDEITRQYGARKYAVSGREIEGWLVECGLEVEERLGPATFWALSPGQT